MTNKNDAIKILPDRKLMLTIGCDHEVPWPETLSDGDFAWPKDYRMNDFPKTPEGEIWYDAPDDEYFSWLADYLPANLPPLTEEQQNFFDNRNKHKHLSGFWIGWHAGWHDSESTCRLNYEFPVDFQQSGNMSAVTGREDAYTYQDYAESNADILEPRERQMTPEEFILEDFGWHLVLEEEKKQFDHYWLEFGKLDGINIVLGISSVYNEPADAGWRVYLGMALQLITIKSDRIKEIKAFYHEWKDMVSK
ncbi:MAG: hypothetical protein J7L57_01275 [Deltaproteobacteria bacterium]|nr:hypothetical protein [Candidatus Tharpella sp.]